MRHQMMTKKMKSETITISLTKEEALILSDWLYQNSRKEELFSDIAEQTVFWNIECLLEKVLEPSDYSTSLIFQR